MIEVRRSEHFIAWLRELRDRAGAKVISKRLIRAQAGNLGDVKYFDGIGEMRVDFGPGYRLYFVRRGQAVIFLLCGGDKSSQVRDIVKARELAEEI